MVNELEVGQSALPPPAVHDPLWLETYGGTLDDRSFSVVEVSTGGFVVVGSTRSYGAGGRDTYLVRTDSSGNLLWNKSFGGASDDTGVDVKECSTGGFIIIGWTESFGAGGRDIWMIRTDSSGSHLWNKTFGGGNTERAEEIVECSGGGFTFIGRTSSYGAGNEDVWLIHTDIDGNHLWNQTFGGGAVDYGYGLVECGSGGYAITGWTQSYGAGGYDVWLIRTDSSGNHQWDETFGGGDDDRGNRVIECTGGGFAIAADTYSFSAGYADAWLLRTDSSGNHLWNLTWGDAYNDYLRYLIEVSDGSFAASGVAATQLSPTGYDLFLTRVDSSGTPLWSRTYGGGAMDEGNRIIEVSAGGYLIAGESRSYGGADEVMLLRIPSDISPTWVEAPTNQAMFDGSYFAYDLNATDPSGLDTWWLNDTTNFAIDGNGIITSVPILAVGLYGLNVSVNNTLGDVLSGEFTLTVQLSTTTTTTTTTPGTFFGTPIEIILLLALVIAIIIIAIIMLLRRRSREPKYPTEPKIDEPTPLDARTPVRAEEALRRRQLLEQVLARYDSISLKDLAKVLEFRRVSDLQQWLLSLPPEFPLRVDRDIVRIDRSRSRDEIDALIKKIEDVEGKGEGKQD